MYLIPCSPRSPGLIPSRGGVFFSGWWHSANPSRPVPSRPGPSRPEPVWQKMDQSSLNGATQPVDIKEKGWSSTMNRQWLNRTTAFSLSWWRSARPCNFKDQLNLDHFSSHIRCNNVLHTEIYNSIFLTILGYNTATPLAHKPCMSYFNQLFGNH